MQSKKHYITGLKGISCVFIMIGHFLGLYKYAQHFVPGFSLLDTILNSRISFVLDEGYWLYLFFYLSGYLVAKSQVKTVKDVVLKSINRFFRFAFPILFSYLVIYLISIFIGFHNSDTKNLFECFWFQKYYADHYSIIDVLRGPIDVLFLGNHLLNTPYWVLREMFASSIIIYIVKYCYCILSKKNETLCFCVLMAITFASFAVSSVVFACLLGMLISIYEDVEGILKKPCVAVGILLMSLMQYLALDHYVINTFFLFLIILAPKVHFIDACLSLKPFKFLGEISWGIYSFHWPLMCALGALLIIKLQPQTGLFVSYVISCFVVFLVTVATSIIFKFTFEKLSSYLSSTINTYIKQITQYFLASKY